MKLAKHSKGARIMPPLKKNGVDRLIVPVFPENLLVAQY